MDTDNDYRQNTDAGNSGKHLILYIEDSQANLRLVSRILEKQADIALITAEDGRTGIELIKSNELDLVLLDINLPDMSGYDVLKFIRSDMGRKHVKVLILSADAFHMTSADKGDHDYDGYITKPFEIKDFLDRVYGALS